MFGPHKITVVAFVQKSERSLVENLVGMEGEYFDRKIYFRFNGDFEKAKLVHTQLKEAGYVVQLSLVMM